tara:strand:+ start:11145 stop:11936 length:792 start_codon:yes stop_codon:yes gene_type:complete
MSTVLITGPTAGIGKSLAVQMAEKGYDLLLVARREHRLKEISAEIKEKYNVKVDYFVADLKDKSAPQAIYNFTKSLNLDISTLMLNAGYQINTKLEDASLDDEEDCLRVLGISVIMLTKLFLNNLKQRGGGHIMVVSSMAAFAPPSGEFAVLYGPVKTFMNRFVEALNGAYNKHNIFATSACPGFTITEFHEVSGVQERMDKVPNYMKMSADDVAKESINGMFKRKEVIITGGLNRFLVATLRWFPKSLIKVIGNTLAGGRYK